MAVLKVFSISAVIINTCREVARSIKLPEKQLGNQAFPSNRNTNLTEQSGIMDKERIKRQKAAKTNAAPCDINKSPDPTVQNLQDKAF